MVTPLEPNSPAWQAVRDHSPDSGPSARSVGGIVTSIEHACECLRTTRNGLNAFFTTTSAVCTADYRMYFLPRKHSSITRMSSACGASLEKSSFNRHGCGLNLDAKTCHLSSSCPLAARRQVASVWDFPTPGGVLETSQRDLLVVLKAKKVHLTVARLTAIRVIRQSIL